MLSTSEAERSRLFIVMDAEIRTKDSLDRISAVQEPIFSYLREKVPNLPGDIFSFDSYEHPSGVLLSTEKIQTSTLKIWACRLSEPDAAVPGRTWSVELLIGEPTDKVVFASRLSCFSRNLDFYFEPGVPRVYKDIAAKNILFGDGVRLQRSPTDITNEDELAWLLALINNKRRTRDVIAIACDETGASVLNPNSFANRLCGIAHIVRIFPEASFKLSDNIGRHLSVFDCGARVYRPTSQVENDEPFRHPLYTRRRLQTIDAGRANLTIAREAFRTSAEGSLREQAVPSFIQLRSANSTFRLAEQKEVVSYAITVDGLLKQLEIAKTGKEAAEAQAREALDLAMQEETFRKRAEEERDMERSRAMAIMARVRHLEERVTSTPTQQIRPKNYEDIQGWLESQFAGRLRLHSRALRALRDAEYENVELVCELLELLAIDYVDSKLGNRDAWAKFETELTRSGVQISKSISESRAGEQGEEYFVNIAGRKEFLEWHIKKGTSRNPKKDLRIYFFWDEVAEEVVVGYLPGHLDTRLT